MIRRIDVSRPPGVSSAMTMASRSEEDDSPFSMNSADAGPIAPSTCRTRTTLAAAGNACRPATIKHKQPKRDNRRIMAKVIAHLLAVRRSEIRGVVPVLAQRGMFFQSGMSNFESGAFLSRAAADVLSRLVWGDDFLEIVGQYGPYSAGGVIDAVKAGGACFSKGVVMNRTVSRIAMVLFLLLSVCAGSGSAAASCLDHIEAGKLLRVCVWPDYYGISFRNPKTQQLSGVDVDMARELGKDLGVKVQFVDSSFARLVDDVLQEHCDIAMFAIGVTPGRMKYLRFTTPHLASDIYAIASKTNPRIKDWSDIDKPGTVVAVAKGTLHEPVMKDKLKAARLLVLDTPFAREQEVQSGRADVFMTDYPYSQRFLVNADWAKLIAPPGKYHVTPYAYAMKPGDDVWYSRVERFVRDIKRDGRLSAAASRYGLSSIVVP